MTSALARSPSDGWTRALLTDDELDCLPLIARNPSTHHEQGRVHLGAVGPVFLKHAHPEHAPGLEQEYQWCVRGAGCLPELPRPVDFRQTRRGAYFLMDDLGPVLVVGGLAPASLPSLRPIVRLLARIHDLDPWPGPVTRARSAFTDHLVQRLQELQRRWPGLHDLLSAGTTINGRPVAGVAAFLDKLRSSETLLDGLGHGTIHGDAYLGNFLRDRHGHLRVVDPSGAANRPFIHDLGKLGQSIIGRIDAVRAGAEIAVRRRDGFSFRATRGWPSLVEEVVREYVKRRRGLDPEGTRRGMVIASAACLLAIVPRYRNEAMTRQVAVGGLFCAGLAA